MEGGGSFNVYKSESKGRFFIHHDGKTWFFNNFEGCLKHLGYSDQVISDTLEDLVNDTGGLYSWVVLPIIILLVIVFILLFNN
jgi:hypothetical protein